MIPCLTAYYQLLWLDSAVHKRGVGGLNGSMTGGGGEERGGRVSSTDCSMKEWDRVKREVKYINTQMDIYRLQWRIPTFFYRLVSRFLLYVWTRLLVFQISLNSIMLEKYTDHLHSAIILFISGLLPIAHRSLLGLTETYSTKIYIN